MQFEHVWVEDVTQRPGLVNMANWMCARSYTGIYGVSRTGERMSSAEEMFKSLISSSWRRSHVLMAFGVSEQNGEAIPLGTSTIRFATKGLDEIREPFEFMELLVPENGWAKFVDFGFDVESAIEGSRLAFNAQYTDACDQLRVEVYRQLHHAGALIGMSYGCNQVWGILPRALASFISQKAGIRLSKVIGLRKNSPLYDEVYCLLPRYWTSACLYYTRGPANTYRVSANEMR